MTPQPDEPDDFGVWTEPTRFPLTVVVALLAALTVGWWWGRG
jgi:hypothetical protein